jgi:hypothetical protein
MAPRVNSELLLVGSLPAESTDSALRSAAGFFGDLVFALPDGETGPRAGWVSYERERLARPNPGVVVVQETESPTGFPRHAYETPVFGIRPGVTELHFDSWPRIDDAIASYSSARSSTWSQVTPAFSWALCCRSTGLRGYGAGTRRHRVTSPASGWRCTAGSAVSPVRTAPRPCGSTRASSAPSGVRNDRERPREA